MRLHLVGVAVDDEDDESREHHQHQHAHAHAVAGRDARNARRDTRGERVHRRGQAAGLRAQHHDHDGHHGVQPQRQDHRHEHEEVHDSFLVGTLQGAEERHEAYKDGDKQVHIVPVLHGDALERRLHRTGFLHHLEEAAEQQDGQRDGDGTADGARTQHARDGRHEHVPQPLRVGLHDVVRPRNSVAVGVQLVRAARHEPAEHGDEADDPEQDDVGVRHLEFLLALLGLVV